jgi:hypothetical protein
MSVFYASLLCTSTVWAATEAVVMAVEEATEGVGTKAAAITGVGYGYAQVACYSVNNYGQQFSAVAYTAAEAQQLAVDACYQYSAECSHPDVPLIDSLKTVETGRPQGVTWAGPRLLGSFTVRQFCVSKIPLCQMFTKCVRAVVERKPNFAALIKESPTVSYLPTI